MRGSFGGEAPSGDGGLRAWKVLRGEAQSGEGGLREMLGGPSREIGRGPVRTYGGGGNKISKPPGEHLPWVGKLFPKKMWVFQGVLGA